MELYWDTHLGFISEFEGGADVLLAVEFLPVLRSFSPRETREVGDLCCHRGSEFGIHIPSVHRAF